METVKVVCFVLLLPLVVEADSSRSGLPSAINDIGLGYNLLYGNPDGTDWRSGGEDPGLLATRHIFNLETEVDIPEQIIYEAHDSCQSSRTDELIFSPKSYQQELLRRITLSGNQNGGLQNLAFTLSSGYQTIKTDTDGLHYVIQDSSVTCIQGTARYKMSLVDTNFYFLTNEFITAVCGLPESYDEASYVGFIDSWGTHIVSGLKLGSRQTSRTIGKLRDYVEKIIQTVPADVHVVSSQSTSQSSYEVDTDSLKIRPDFPIPIQGKTYVLQTGISSSPTSAASLEPVGLNLTSIDVALTDAFWKQNQDLTGACPANISQTLDARRQNLMRALTNYGTIKGAVSPPAEELSMPVVWPMGTFGLPKPKVGCPDQASRFLEGWLKQNMETQTPDSRWDAAHLDGTLSKTLFDLRFCIKTDSSEEFSLDWPAGDYCIFKYHACPKDFSEGFVQWDDEDTNNANAHGGVLPDGVYGRDIQMKYCCRGDGETYNPITLPTETPFYLFKYKQDCQEVDGMTHTTEYLLWDDDDTKSTTSANIGSVHPGMRFCNPPTYPGCGTASTIYYCYYQPKDDTGSIIVG